ncbi:XdhC family protein [Thalassobius sp. Cn5-15]|uniref:XdhC family protein n=1 Tax=Thalassobius sp. Cn5-15 TaxID=2917763 RepID=UPI001EF2454E|nr:XdhC family protein [Thalassobius sp. Cn5-15]
MLPFETGPYAECVADIIDVAARLIQGDGRFALITSIAIEGGAAREVGSLAIVEADGTMTGYLSNGCIDRDIQHRALMALVGNRKEVVRYGEGSRFVDLKLPCGGALEVLIDPDPDRDMLRQAKRDFDARRQARLSCRANATDQNTHYFTYEPRVRLCLAGRGAIFRSMAQLGHATGYEVFLISPDTEDLEATQHFSTQPSVHLRSFDQAVDLSLIDRRTAFLTLFHDHDWEPHLLQKALQRPAGFIGSLGSRRTHMMRCDTLRGMGATEEDISRLNGPIGLVGSLRDASLIAVSSLAEIVSMFPSQLVSARQSGAAPAEKAVAHTV